MLGATRDILDMRNGSYSDEELLQRLYETMVEFFKEFDAIRPQLESEPSIKFVSKGLEAAHGIVNALSDRAEWRASLSGNLIEEIPVPATPQPKPVRRRRRRVAVRLPEIPIPVAPLPDPAPAPPQKPPEKPNWLSRIRRLYGSRTS
jgi:hypothetical protein